MLNQRLSYMNTEKCHLWKKELLMNKEHLWNGSKYVSVKEVPKEFMLHLNFKEYQGQQHGWSPLKNNC